MLKFDGGVKIQKWFGDFGGDCGEYDTNVFKKKQLAEEYEKILVSEEFCHRFEKNLELIRPVQLGINKIKLADGRELLIAPALTRYYILAGYLAVADILGKKKVCAGTYLKEIALVLAKACQELNFESSVILSRQLSRDTPLINQLEGLGSQVDSSTCLKLMDTPYVYASLAEASDCFVIPVEANYGLYPIPGLTGAVAGLFGDDLKKCLDEIPECCVVPITTGTEAVGVFKAFLDTECRLVTAEDLIAQEYHIEDLGAYTLSTRSAEFAPMTTTICPELADWWRLGKVARLGGDRILPVNTEFLGNTGLSPAAVRAAALACEKTGCIKLLVLEAK